MTVFLTLFALAACSGGTPDGTAGTQRSQGSDWPAELDTTTLRRGNGPEPDTLDPQTARSDAAFHILRDLYEGLTAVGPDGNVVPAAAESWTVTADGRTWTFRLREGLRWSNGDPVVAADYVTGLRHLVDPRTAAPYAHVVEPILNAAAIVRGEQPSDTLGVAATDDRTLTVTLAKPAPYLLGLFAQPPTFPRHAAAHVSNGAFAYADWIPGSHVEARRNRHYWNDEATQLELVHYVHVGDAGAELRHYRAGELDTTYVVPPQQFRWIRDNLGDELHVSPQLGVYYYGFNLAAPPFKDDPGLRRALSLVIDRDKLVAAVTGVGERPAWGWVPDGVANYASPRFDYAARPHAERIAEARALYAKSGYGAGRPLRLELRYSTGDQHNRIAVAIASMWKQALGVETTLYAEEFKALLESVKAGRAQVFRASWVGDYDDPWTFAQLLQSGFGTNHVHYANPRYDALLEVASAEPDVARRRALLEQAEQVMLTDHPVLPLYFYVNKHLVKPWVRGWSDNAMNVVYSKDLRIAEPT